MNYRHHIIRNFPEGYPFWKKIFANIIFFIFGTVVHHRKNFLNHWDMIRAARRLKKGDVVLVGGLRRLSSLVIGDVVTHSLIYAGGRHFVHSVVDGVEGVSLHAVFCEYDTMVILRPKYAKKTLAHKAVEYALAQIGKPYDFDFKPDAEKFYCSELIYDAFHETGFDLGVSLKRGEGPHHTLLPVNFLDGNFRVVFLSHNLRRIDGKLCHCEQSEAISST